MQRNTLSAMLVLGLSVILTTGCQVDTPTAASDAVLNAQLGAVSQARGAEAAVNADIAALRALTAPYHNVEKAALAGYAIETRCVSHPTLGAMGYHAPNLALRNDAEISLLKPDVLVYEKGPNGKHRLVAVEYFAFKSTWDAAHGGATAAPPTLFGASVPLSDHPPFGQHYELHVWLFKHNPSGMFASWNPDVTCP